ncbi:MAG: ATP-binding protein [Clostridia bacterium]|nr:ATP-binding protein [Clostridia bacterium]
MIIGREKEREMLREAMRDDRSHFIAIYGRRRIGKTFLIRETFEDRFTFQHAGLSNRGKADQLFSFAASLKDVDYFIEKPLNNWLEAFECLKDVVRKSSEKKKIIFIDELSWMDSRNSDLLAALEHFWNGWASARKDVVLIICASATSWMLSKVIHHKGGLYHRLTEQIQLKSFTLSECMEYTQSEGFALNQEQVLQYYMIFGGVPFYWQFLRKGLSIPQNIDRIFFAPDAPLKDEYQYLYASIFKHPEHYLQIIHALGQKKAGMTREELVESAGVHNSGDLTMRLEELESCGFIRKYFAYGMKKKNAVYQLVDFFTLFYLHFMDKKGPVAEDYWTLHWNNPEINTWMGLAFERVCLEHITQIKKALGIAGIYTEVNSWYCTANLEKGIFGSQIDLLIVRQDRVINLCEMKYSGMEFIVTEKVNRDIRKKINDLTVSTKTKNAIYPVLITTYGLEKDSSAGIFQNVITMNALFD